MDLKVKASGRSKTHYGLESSSDFWLRGAFCVLSPFLFVQTGFLPLFPCQDYSLEVCTRDKRWLFTLVSVVASIFENKQGWLCVSNLKPVYLPPHFLPVWVQVDQLKDGSFQTAFQPEETVRLSSGKRDKNRSIMCVLRKGTDSTVRDPILPFSFSSSFWLVLKTW